MSQASNTASDSIAVRQMTRVPTDRIFTPSTPYDYRDSIPAGRWVIGSADEILPDSPVVEVSHLPIRIDEGGEPLAFLVAGQVAGGRLALVREGAFGHHPANLVLHEPGSVEVRQTAAYAPAPHFRGSLRIEVGGREIAMTDRNGTRVDEGAVPHS